MNADQKQDSKSLLADLLIRVYLRLKRQYLSEAIFSWCGF